MARSHARMSALLADQRTRLRAYRPIGHADPLKQPPIIFIFQFKSFKDYPLLEISYLKISYDFSLYLNLLN